MGCDVIYASRIPQSIPTHFPVSSFLAVHPRTAIQCLCFSLLDYEMPPPTHTLLPPPPPSSTQWPFGIPHDWFHMSVHITAWKTLQQQYIFLLQSVGIHFIRIGQLVRRGNIVFIWCDQPAAVCKPVLEAASIPTLHCSV